MNVGQKIQAVYDMEVNAEISWFWDAGFVVYIGDDENGWTAFDEGFSTFEDAVNWLYSRAVEICAERKEE